MRASRTQLPSLWLLAFMMSVGAFGDTEYTPAMPAIAQALHTPYNMVQLSMAAYLVSLSVSQLFFGPISDRYGRRPTMLAGAVILAGGALACAWSNSIWPLIGGRFIQGIGACAGGVIASACVRDVFPADERQAIYAKLNAAFAVAPAVGPMVGTYVASALGWRANFLVLTIVSGALLLTTWRWLPETLAKRVDPFSQPTRVLGAMRRVAATPGFLFFALLGGLCLGMAYTALIDAPDLVINVLGMGGGGIVVIAIVILVAVVIGDSLCAFLSPRINPWIIVGAALLVLVTGSALLFIVAARMNGHIDFVLYLAPIALCFVGVGLCLPVTTAKAMAPFGDRAGTASSLLGFVRMGVAALATLVMSVIHRGSAFDMPIMFLGLSVAGALMFATYRLAGTRHRGHDVDT
ncbi:MAG TPA: multidrug effflux MFS transporter [Nevskiaceae bacterium]